MIESLLIVSMRIVAYCLMPNHWHFVLWPAQDDQLSDFMQQMTTTHVRRWQRAHQSEGQGHVYQGRFKAFSIQDDDHSSCVHTAGLAVCPGCVQYELHSP